MLFPATLKKEEEGKAGPQPSQQAYDVPGFNGIVLEPQVCRVGRNHDTYARICGYGILAGK
jgi:hypothetical protein